MFTPKCYFSGLKNLKYQQALKHNHDFTRTLKVKSPFNGTEDTFVDKTLSKHKLPSQSAVGLVRKIDEKNRKLKRRLLNPVNDQKFDSSQLLNDIVEKLGKYNEGNEMDKSTRDYSESSNAIRKSRETSSEASKFRVKYPRSKIQDPSQSSHPSARCTNFASRNESSRYNQEKNGHNVKNTQKTCVENDKKYDFSKPMVFVSKSLKDQNLSNDGIKSSSSLDSTVKTRTRKRLNCVEPPKSTSSSNDSDSERISKRIARCTELKRREAEMYVLNGRVKVDGQLVTNLATRVNIDQKVELDDRELFMSPPEIYIFNKVKNMIISHSKTDILGRNTLGQLLDEMKRKDLNSVGRLDYTTEGLLLLTNDGELKRNMELPVNHLIRVYRARVFGKLSSESIEKLKRGITIDGIHYGPIDVAIEDRESYQNAPSESQSKVPRENQKSGNNNNNNYRANYWLRIKLYEGKNREIKKVLKYLGLEISRLIRIQYGPYKINDIPPGAVLKIAIKPELMKFVNRCWLRKKNLITKE